MNQNVDCIFHIEDALEMILLFDQMGIISFANAMARKNLGYDSLCGVHISEIFPNTFKSTENGFETDYSFGEEHQNLVAYRKNLTCFPAEVRIINSDVSQGIYICMANDILEKEYLNREIENVRQDAEHALKVKSEFIANVTHELRTPVNGVLGNVKELLATEHDEHTKKSLRLIERCCGDMNKIINNILDFSKLEAGKFTLEPRKFSFRNMLDYVRENHINKLNEKGLGFFMTISPQIPEYIIGDELRITQILNNLLSNAQKFTSVGKITVEVLRTARVNDKIELFFIVSDTGIGIDSADKSKLFQSFSQVDASISRKYGGTGLGLNICKQLVELMGGRIEVESEKNRGSTFSFSIWVELCDEDKNTSFQPADKKQASLSTSFIQNYSEKGSNETDNIKRYGTAENRENLKRNMSKMILCIEMDNWEKAEMFMDVIKQLTENAPSDVSRTILKLKMAIQKENYDKVIAEYNALEKMIESEVQQTV
ncbi:MAG: hypothetical protein K2J91_06175 [Lachnospiraceae bacterium]|nr:hypothetical protein [Lachnospiraceae bacterium]